MATISDLNLLKDIMNKTRDDYLSGKLTVDWFHGYEISYTALDAWTATIHCDPYIVFDDAGLRGNEIVFYRNEQIIGGVMHYGLHTDHEFEEVWRDACTAIKTSLKEFGVNVLEEYVDSQKETFKLLYFGYLSNNDKEMASGKARADITETLLCMKKKRII